MVQLLLIHPRGPLGTPAHDHASVVNHDVQVVPLNRGATTISPAALAAAPAWVISRRIEHLPGNAFTSWHRQRLGAVPAAGERAARRSLPRTPTTLERSAPDAKCRGSRSPAEGVSATAAWSILAVAALGDGGTAAELFSLINPINHASARAGVYRYKVEPYVMAADVYTEPPHVGRGGWTWYTGSAGWMYQAGIEGILGFRLRERTLVLDPCIPPAWPGYEVAFRYRTARYAIVVENPNGVSRGVVSRELDGRTLANDDGAIPLVDDGATHAIRVVLG
jgi:cyclic beta-1,2-glucan synthetase